MRIHRAVSGEVTAVPTALLHDGRLSYRARGILLELLSRPDDWVERVDDLLQYAKQERDEATRESRASMRAALAELEDCGYIFRTQYRERGGFAATFDVFAEPTEREVPPDAVRLSFRRKAYVYRHWDEDDRLLYVGITEWFQTRQRIHRKNSRWMPLVSRTTKEVYSTRKEAEEAESTAIASEAPVFNVSGNDSPEDRRRLLEYLMERGRTDLLAPGVSSA